MKVHRRAMLTGALAAGAFASAVARAKATPTRPMIIDGNLVPPIDPDAPLDAATAAAVRSSGLTALKASIGGADSDFEHTTKEIDDFDKAIVLNPAIFMQVKTAGDFATAQKSGRIGLIYSFEGVEMFGGQIDRIDHFHARGVKVMQLSYNKPSPFASGVLSPQPSAGLTPLGRQAIARMNAIGVTLDLSHADEASTLAAIAVAAKPPLITHAGCAAVYAHPRNKSDKALRAVAAKGGVVGIFDLAFLTAPPVQPAIDDYLRHMIHALDVCGEDHVGIGSDAFLMPFDTSADNMADWDKQIAARKAAGVGAPEEGRPPFVVGLNRPDRYQVIAAALAGRGYKAATIDKVLGLNFARVFGETWAV